MSQTLVKQNIDKQTLSIFIRDLASNVNVNLKHMIEDIIKVKDVETTKKNYHKQKKPVMKKKDLIIQQQEIKRKKQSIDNDIKKIDFIFKNLKDTELFEPLQNLTTDEGIIYYKTELLKRLWKKKKKYMKYIIILYYHLKDESSLSDESKKLLTKIGAKLQDQRIKEYMLKHMGDMLEPLFIYDKRDRKFDNWQTDVIQYIKQKKSIIVKARTSSGKSWVAMATGIIHKKILYVCPAKPVAYQVGAHFIHMGYKVHFLVDNLSHHSYGPDTNIYIGTPQEVEQNLMKNGISYDYAVFDEIHNVNKEEDGDIYENIIKLIPCNFLALSATIGNSDYLQDVFQTIHPEKDIKFVEYDQRFINQQKWLWDKGKLQKLHPLCCIDKIDDTPLSMTPNDCSTLWDALEEEFEDEESVIKTCSPDEFFTEERLASLDDCKRYETFLQETLMSLQKSYPDKISNVLKEFKGPIVRKSDIDISDMVEFIHTIGDKKMFPMIMFHTEQHICKGIFQRLFIHLEEKELEHHPYHYDILEKKEDLYQKYKEKRDTFESNITISKGTTDARIEKEAKIKAFNEREMNQYIQTMTSYFRSKLNDIQRSELSDECKEIQTKNLQKEMQSFLKHPDFCSQDVFKKHPDYIFSVTNEPMSADTIRNVRREIMKTLNIKIPYEHYLFQLLKRGIGLYIEDMPDEYNWIIQKLLSKKQIAVIISDRTLCLGIDLPVRTSCFLTGCSYTNEDYIQMSGRAGRRGQDTQGNIVFYKNEDYLSLMKAGLPMIKGTTKPIYSHYQVLHQKYNPEKVLVNMIDTKRKEEGDNSYREYHGYEKILWGLRGYKYGLQFVKHLSGIEGKLFALSESERSIKVIHYIQELLEDNGKEIIEAYVSRNISKCPVTTLKKYIDILQIICNSLHPKKYFILYNISKELFTIFNTMVFKAFLL